MDNGGHGKIGYYIDKRMVEVTIPPVKVHTFDLPESFLSHNKRLNVIKLVLICHHVLEERVIYMLHKSKLFMFPMEKLIRKLQQ